MLFNHVDIEFPKIIRVTAEDGSRVYETPTGEKYPSVTTVVSLVKKDIINEWRARVGEEEANRISSTAARRGTRIHTLCEQYISNHQAYPEMFDIEMWNTFRPLLHNINNVYAIEQALYSHHLAVAGTVDCIAEYNGKMSVVDFKTSKRIKSRDDIHDYFMQCAAYAVAFEEMTEIPVPQLVVLMAVDDEAPLVFIEKRNTWIDKFIDLREKYRKAKSI